MIDLTKVLKEFQCDDCSLAFSDHRQLFLHRKCHTSMFRSLITEEILLEESCPLCFVRYTEKYEDRSLEELLGSGRTLEESEQETKSKHLILCKYYPKCSVEFSRICDFIKHARDVHNDGKSNEHDCFYCDKKFRVPSALKRHLRRHLPTLETFRCPLCPREYTAKHSLTCHMKNHYKMFRCHLCAKEYARKDSLTQHLLSNHKEVNIKSHGCSRCDKKFSTPGELKKHSAVHLPTSEVFKCHLCPKEYTSKHSIKNHLRTHYTMFRCHLCGKEYARKESLSQHLLSRHKEVNIKSHDCSQCDRKFSRRSELKKHSRVHLTASENLKCHLCPKEFSYKLSLKTHLEWHNSRENLNGFICGICSMRFAYPQSLRRHELRHTGHKPFGCDHCDKKFFSSSERKMHQYVHDDPLQCEYCGKIYYGNKRLEKHLKRQHDSGKQPIACEHCGQKFELERSLKKHLDSEKESKNTLRCKNCPKTFKNLNCFIYHRRSHAGFLCEFCKRKYFTRDGLKKHLEAHGSKSDSCSKQVIAEEKQSHEKLLKCSLCPKEYRNMRALKHHMLKHEGNEPYVCKHCGKRFTLEIYLKAHLNPEKETKHPLACKECPKTFKNMNCLVHHKRSHGEEFSCEVCKVKCFTREGFKGHLAKHGIISDPVS